MEMEVRRGKIVGRKGKFLIEAKFLGKAAIFWHDKKAVLLGIRK